MHLSHCKTGTEGRTHREALCVSDLLEQVPVRRQLHRQRHMRGRQEDLSKLDDIWVIEPAEASAPQTASQPWALLLVQVTGLTRTALHSPQRDVLCPPKALAQQTACSSWEGSSCRGFLVFRHFGLMACRRVV